MSKHIYKKTEVVGSSKDSIEEAIRCVVQSITDMSNVGIHSPCKHVPGLGGSQGSANPSAVIDEDSRETREQRRLLAR